VYIVEHFMRWWNMLAGKNGKQKFRTQKEAFDFIQRSYEESGGPNSKILAMRKRYEEVNSARQAKARSNKGRDQAVVA
jgi:hypothetical protein